MTGPTNLYGIYYSHRHVLPVIVCDFIIKVSWSCPSRHSQTHYQHKVAAEFEVYTQSNRVAHGVPTVATRIDACYTVTQESCTGGINPPLK